MAFDPLQSDPFLFRSEYEREQIEQILVDIALSVPEPQQLQDLTLFNRCKPRIRIGSLIPGGSPQDHHEQTHAQTPHVIALCVEQLLSAHNLRGSVRGLPAVFVAAEVGGSGGPKSKTMGQSEIDELDSKVFVQKLDVLPVVPRQYVQVIH